MNEPVNCTGRELEEFLCNLAEGYLPCISSEPCTSSQELAEGFLVTYYSDTSPSVQSKSMSIANKSYQRGKKTVVFHGSPSFQMSRNLTDDRGAELLTWFRAGFHARTSAQLEKAPGSTASEADFGEKWRELSVRYDRDSCSWRTHRCLWDEDLSACSLTLPKCGLMRDGVLSERMTLALPTAANAAGLWPTPTASEHTGPGHATQGGLNLRTAVAMWPTPKANDAEKRGNFDATNPRNGLPAAVKLWPTPLATDGSKGGPNQKGGKGDLRLASAVHQFPTPTATNTKAHHMRGADNG